ncbi:MAG TPA: ribbon-helix-helix protein, CopG family [Thermoanaerobaculia bacterium]
MKLPDSLDKELEAQASRKGVTKSVVIREALSGYLVRTGASSRMSFTALAGDLAGCVEGPDDLSTSKNHLAGYGR